MCTSKKQVTSSHLPRSIKAAVLFGAWLSGASSVDASDPPSLANKAPTFDRAGRPDLGFGPPTGELDLPDALWPGTMERYWLDVSPDAHVVFQRLLANVSEPLPARAQKTCAPWLSSKDPAPTVAALLFAHLFDAAPGAATSPSRVGFLCKPKSSPARWACQVDRFAESNPKRPTASLRVELLADQHLLQLDTLHCSVSHVL